MLCFQVVISLFAKFHGQSDRRCPQGYNLLHLRIIRMTVLSLSTCPPKRKLGLPNNLTRSTTTMTAAIMPRFLLPQGALRLRFHPRTVLTIPLAAQRTLPQCRHASKKSSPSKPIVLEKPTKFNPPSHGARLKSKAPRQYPGPPLSAQQVEDQKTKQYPHMMPPEGSFLYWFLTNRYIHLFITLV